MRTPNEKDNHSDTHRNWVADEVLREIWRIKDQLSAAYNHNLDRLFAEARERQRRSRRPSVNLEKQNKQQMD